MLMEITTFRLADGAGEEEFVAADKAVQEEFFHRQTGLVRRTAACGAEGSWVVVTLWGSDEYADAAAEAAPGDPHWTAFTGLLDNATLDVRRYETLD